MAWLRPMAAVLLAAAAPDRPAVVPLPPAPRPDAPIQRPPDKDWPKYCADAAMTGQAHDETLISTTSIATMHLAWKTLLPGSVASSPTIVAGRVYVGDWAGFEWALDAPSGQVLASANLGTTPLGNCAPPGQGITSAAAFDRGRLYIAGGDDFFYALNPETLETLWKTKLGDNSPTGGYYGWCSPSALGGRVYQGVASHCDDPFVDGRVVGMEDSSGAIFAAADLSQTSDPSRFGAGVWTSPSIDLEARTVFVTTASAYAYDDGLAYSVVRLSLDDLAIEDSWKIPLDDYNAVPDADWGSSPTLFHDSGGRLLVGASQKDGQYYAFDRARLSQGPVWKTRIAIGGDCPGCGDGSISTAAFDGTRLYVGGGRNQIASVSFPGSVSALDPATGTVLWRFQQFGGPVLAPISVANGVVFATGGSSCVALDAATGRLLWTFKTHPPIFGGVAISDGRIFFGDAGGNLFAFEVSRPPN
jgi:polyvinyl alcohol dehydrogenase (cytochrome)